MSRTIVFFTVICVFIVASRSAAQIADAELYFRSGARIEGTVVAYSEGHITVEHEVRYGPLGEYTRPVKDKISLDSVRTLRIGESSAGVQKTTLFTLLGLGVGAVVAANDKGPMSGLAIVVMGGLGAIAGIIAGISTDSHETLYSLAVRHDAQLVDARLGRTLPGDVKWGKTPATSSVRETVGRVAITMKDGSEIEGMLIDVGVDRLLVLLEEESLAERAESEELRTLAFQDIAFIEQASFSRSGTKPLSRWYPDRHDVRVLIPHTFASGKHFGGE